MRIHQFHKASAAANQGEPMEPTKNEVWVELAASGNGAVNATVQMKGRINALSMLQNIGSPVTISGTAAPGSPVTDSFQVKARAMPNMPLENIGSPVTISGTNYHPSQAGYKAMGTELYRVISEAVG